MSETSEKIHHIRIEPLQITHLEAIYGIETRSFAVPWSMNELRRDFTTNKHAFYLVALDGDKEDQVAGYAGLWHIVNEGHINNIAVDEPYRGHGVGSKLMEGLIALAQQKEMIGLTLEVRMGNRAAMGLYSKYGFKMEGIRKNYYAETKEDAVIMWKYFV